MGYLLLSGTDTNDSDQTFTVPDGMTYELLYGHVTLATTSTVGNRQLRLVCQSSAGGNIVWDVHAGNTQAASLTYEYSLAQGVYRETTVTDNSLGMPLATDLVLLPGYTIRVYDTSATDAAADDMTIRLMVKTSPVK